MAPRYLAFLASGALALAACGGESFSGAESDKRAEAKGSNPVCPQRQARLTDAPRKQGSPGKRTTVDLSKVPGGNAGRVGITVKGVSNPSRVEDVFTDKGQFRTGTSDQFVAVEYEFKNLGKRKVEAANSVNETFVVADATGRAWLRADGTPDCSALSAGAAVKAGATSPEGEVAPGKGYDTTVLYVVARDAKRLSWVGPGVRIPLKPR